MKKTLVALAAAAATGAFAQSNVTLYGLFDINYGTTKTTNGNGTQNRKTTGLGEGVQAGNRIGFRGTEDLGGGLKAGFVIETAFSPTTTDIYGNRASNSGHNDTAVAVGNAVAGGGAFTAGGGSQNRQSFVSLSGGFGEARIGYHYTNMYEISSLGGYLAGFEGNAGADTAHTYGSGVVGGARANGITYIAPKFGAVEVRLQYGSAANPAISTQSAGFDSTGVKRTGIMATYANGPLKVSAAHTSAKTTVAAAGANGASTTGKLTQVGASYNFGVASVVGTYNSGEDGAAVANDYKAYQIGVNVPLGAATLFAATGSAETTGSSVADFSMRQFGATYTLSKRTNLYAVSGTTKNNTIIAAGGAAAAKGTSTRFGVRHTF
jgi:predicted porin